MDRVEPAVAAEVRVERDVAEALAEAAPGEELRRECRGHVEVDVWHAVLDQVSRLVTARTAGRQAHLKAMIASITRRFGRVESQQILAA